LTDNVFLRPVRIETNRLIGPSGIDVPGERTLGYYIAHEITHTWVARKVGPVPYVRLPDWVDEGYCDHVAKGTDFSYDKAIASYRRRDREMSPEQSGLYLRYHLLVAHLLEKKGISVAELLSGNHDQSRIEREIHEVGSRP